MICYNIKYSKLQGLLQPTSGMEGFRVSKCLPVLENGLNIEMFVVNYSDVDFSHLSLKFPVLSAALANDWLSIKTKQ